MGKLIYATNCSLDGFIEDSEGSFDFAVPTDELHQFFNDFIRPCKTHLYGRSLYETMVVWETWDVSDEPEPVRDFAELWKDTDKIVYSRTLEDVSSARTTLEREFDPEHIRQLKAASDSDLLIGGSILAAEAFAAGLVDELKLTISPVAIGGGKPALPPGQRIDLQLVDERHFDCGTVHLSYAVKS